MLQLTCSKKLFHKTNQPINLSTFIIKFATLLHNEVDNLYMALDVCAAFSGATGFGA